MESRILIVWVQMPKLQQNALFIGQILCLGHGFLVIHLFLELFCSRHKAICQEKIFSSGCVLWQTNPA